MDITNLPKPGAILNPIEIDWMPRLGGDLRDKDVLAIGYNREQLADGVEKHNPRSITLLTKWADHGDAKIDGREVIIGDICTDVFEPNRFDVVATSSVLEHIDLSPAFANIHRILRKGGVFASMFGPVWSGPYGHHLIVVDAEDPNLCFGRWQLPGWMHLLAGPREIREYYKGKGYSDAVIDEVYYCMYENESINRTMFDDYVNTLSENHFTLVRSDTMYSDCPADIYRMLRKKFPRYHDFSTYGAAWVAVKNAHVDDQSV
jgi:SAM-dependent methyltransferase